MGALYCLNAYRMDLKGCAYSYVQICFVFLWASSNGFPKEYKGLFPEDCLPEPLCRSSEIYRSLDGSCNNLDHPAWGMVNTPLVRLLPARYEDDDFQMPKARSGDPLPLARAIRTFLFPNRNVNSDINSLVTMSWGQLIAHDTSRISSQNEDECCSKSAPDDIPSHCVNIDIPKDDEFYSRFNITCQGMTRTTTVDTKFCSPSSPTHQTIAQTHFLDASVVYGVSKQDSDELRTMRGGELATQTSHSGFEYLPNDPSCDTESEDAKCYKAGDDRVNQQPPLTLLHTILVREHNLLCRELAELNPHWSDEKLFQEARKIVIAQLQHITYTQYLPVILGDIAKEKFGSTKFGFGKNYNPRLNPGTLNSFTTAAFRGFHSMISGYIGTRKEDVKCPFQYISLKSAVNNPGLIQSNDRFDDFLRGLTQQPAHEMDPYSSEQITNLLFSGDQPFGIDLIALDILRGRDHGIPAYNTFRASCGYEKAKTFSALSDVMSKTAWTALSDIYQDVEDIDLYVGGLLETRLPGSLVGPTFQCIIMEQFTRWKYGDRFFYDLGGHAGSFDLDQLHEIRKTSLSLLLCRNGNTVTRIQPDSFRQLSRRNDLVKCKRIKKINLKPWRDIW